MKYQAEEKAKQAVHASQSSASSTAHEAAMKEASIYQQAEALHAERLKKVCDQTLENYYLSTKVYYGYSHLIRYQLRIMHGNCDLLKHLNDNLHIK